MTSDFVGHMVYKIQIHLEIIASRKEKLFHGQENKFVSTNWIKCSVFLANFNMKAYKPCQDPVNKEHQMNLDHID